MSWSPRQPSYEAMADFIKNPKKYVEREKDHKRQVAEWREARDQANEAKEESAAEIATARDALTALTDAQKAHMIKSEGMNLLLAEREAHVVDCEIAANERDAAIVARENAQTRQMGGREEQLKHAEVFMDVRGCGLDEREQEIESRETALTAREAAVAAAEARTETLRQALAPFAQEGI